MKQSIRRLLTLLLVLGVFFAARETLWSQDIIDVPSFESFDFGEPDLPDLPSFHVKLESRGRHFQTLYPALIEAMEERSYHLAADVPQGLQTILLGAQYALDAPESGGAASRTPDEGGASDDERYAWLNLSYDDQEAGIPLQERDLAVHYALSTDSPLAEGPQLVDFLSEALNLSPEASLHARELLEEAPRDFLRLPLPGTRSVVDILPAVEDGEVRSLSGRVAPLVWQDGSLPLEEALPQMADALLEKLPLQAGAHAYVYAQVMVEEDGGATEAGSASGRPLVHLMELSATPSEMPGAVSGSEAEDSVGPEAEARTETTETPDSPELTEFYLRHSFYFSEELDDGAIHDALRYLVEHSPEDLSGVPDLWEEASLHGEASSTSERDWIGMAFNQATVKSLEILIPLS